MYDEFMSVLKTILPSLCSGMLLSGVKIYYNEFRGVAVNKIVFNQWVFIIILGPFYGFVVFLIDPLSFIRGIPAIVCFLGSELAIHILCAVYVNCKIEEKIAKDEKRKWRKSSACLIACSMSLSVVVYMCLYIGASFDTATLIIIIGIVITMAVVFIQGVWELSASPFKKIEIVYTDQRKASDILDVEKYKSRSDRINCITTDYKGRYIEREIYKKDISEIKYLYNEKIIDSEIYEYQGKRFSEIPTVKSLKDKSSENQQSIEYDDDIISYECKEEFIISCIEDYAEHSHKSSDKVFKMFEETKLFNLLDKSYEELNGMKREFLMTFLVGYIKEKALICMNAEKVKRKEKILNIIRNISKFYGISNTEAISKFYKSNTGKKFVNQNSGLCNESPEYIFAMYRKEQESDK